MSSPAPTNGAKAIHIRALKIALTVGSILAIINYGDKIWGGQMLTTDWIKLAVTYCVPYLVSLYSGISAAKA